MALVYKAEMQFQAKTTSDQTVVGARSWSGDGVGLSVESPVALVMNGFLNELGTIRSLAQSRHVPIILVCRPGDVAASSRHVDESFFYESEAELLEVLADINRRYQHIIPFPCVDRNVRLLLELRDQLTSFDFPDMDIRLLEKTEQIRIAEEAGIPCPKSVLIAKRSEIPSIDGIRGPYVLRPTSSSAYDRDLRAIPTKAFITESAEAIREKLVFMIDSEIPCIISEYIPGSNSVFSYAGYAREGRVECSYLGRKMVDVHPTLVAAIAESVPLEQEPGISELGNRFIMATGYTGIFELEFKKCARTSDYFFIEMNPRNWLWNELAAVDGVNVSLAAFFGSSDRNNGRTPVKATAIEFSSPRTTRMAR